MKRGRETKQTLYPAAKKVKFAHQPEYDWKQWQQACSPPVSMPQWSDRRQQWVCPQTPMLERLPSGSTRGYPCCLPGVIETREDMQRVAETIHELFGRGFRTQSVNQKQPVLQMFYNKQHFPKRYATIEEANSDLIDHLLWLPYLDGKLKRIDAGMSTLTDARLVYVLDPQSGLLMSTWPSPEDNVYEYLRWLIASEASNDDILSDMEELFENYNHPKHWEYAREFLTSPEPIGLLVFTVSQPGRQSIARYLKNRLHERWLSLEKFLRERVEDYLQQEDENEDEEEEDQTSVL